MDVVAVRLSAHLGCGSREEEMKEVFSKNFWEGVIKTFDEAREDPPMDEVVKIPAEVDGDTSTSESPATGSADPGSSRSSRRS
jgi:hypothetical protein